MDGEPGVQGVLEILCDELDATMGMRGCAAVDDVCAATVDMVSPLPARLPAPADLR